MTGKPASPPASSRAALMRWCRNLHGWLSALAFLALCFFSFTGLLLNHPEWLSASAPASLELQSTLSAEHLETLLWADDPPRELADMATQHFALRGEYSGGNLVGGEIFVRLQGVKGLTDLRANLDTGELTAVIEPAPTLSILNELHRGERAGTAWRWLIDAIAVLLILLSIAGYLIFLLMRFRRRTALLLTAGSAISLFALYHFLVF